jgi:predicted RNase H-like nuclease (RuvC/YqgF family)
LLSEKSAVELIRIFNFRDGTDYGRDLTNLRAKIQDLELRVMRLNEKLSELAGSTSSRKRPQTRDALKDAQIENLKEVLLVLQCELYESQLKMFYFTDQMSVRPDDSEVKVDGQLPASYRDTAQTNLKQAATALQEIMKRRMETVEANVQKNQIGLRRLQEATKPAKTAGAAVSTEAAASAEPVASTGAAAPTDSSFEVSHEFSFIKTARTESQLLLVKAMLLPPPC